MLATVLAASTAQHSGRKHIRTTHQLDVLNRNKQSVVQLLHLPLPASALASAVYRFAAHMCRMPAWQYAA
jgi:hypothetical protein